MSPWRKLLDDFGDPNAPPDETPDRREYRRRIEDLQAWSEIRRFSQNKITRRMTYVLLPLLFSGATYAWTTWKHIPTPAWQESVNVDQQAAKAQFQQIQTKMALLEQRIEMDAQLSAEQRVEIKEEIQSLRGDLQRWFLAASRASR